MEPTSHDLTSFPELVKSDEAEVDLENGMASYDIGITDEMRAKVMAIRLIHNLLKKELDDADGKMKKAEDHHKAPLKHLLQQVVNSSSHLQRSRFAKELEEMSSTAEKAIRPRKLMVTGLAEQTVKLGTRMHTQIHYLRRALGPKRWPELNGLKADLTALRE
ncbi:MAG: hypothetical protein Q9159_003688 [Coniocarpon cinnabarinum]